MWSVLWSFVGLTKAVSYVAGISATVDEKSAGAAGPVVASRLSEINDWKVLLVEAGPDEPAGAEVPANLQLYLGGELDWKYYTTNESFACLSTNGSCYYPRGKNLGGNTVHHGMAYHRGHAKDFTRWVDAGNEGWSWEEVLEYYKKSEDNREIGRVSPKYHAQGGPMTVERLPWQPEFTKSIMEAAEEVGFGVTEDMTGDKVTGFTVAQTISRNGVRLSSVSAFIRPVSNRPNLDVAINAMVTKIITKRKTAIGVELVMNGLTYVVTARKEVIVSGGAINSPQLLLLSGIGPKKHLRSMKVPVVHDLPGVGENFHNHQSFGIGFTLDEQAYSLFTPEAMNQYLYDQTGPMSGTGLAQVTGILASEYTTPDDPDIQIFFAGYQAVCTPKITVPDLATFDNRMTVRFTSVNVQPHSRVPLVNISVVEGKPAELPCDITPPGEDTLHMVFWFKDEAGVPLYTIDAREKPVTKAQHSSDSGVFGPRAYFRTAFPSPAVLVIEDIKRHDAATYRCRVDFRKGQTRSFRYNLTVIVPPEQPTILDQWGRIVNGTAGPYEEGDTPSLTCRVTGGKPEPMVRWLVNGQVKDEEYEKNAGDVIENRLTLQSVGRSDLGLNFTCQARNTDLIEPKESSISLDLNLKPLTVTIRRPGKKGVGDESLLAGKRYEVECETTGSRPPAVITWYKGRRRQLKHTTEERSENRTMSMVEFEPGVEDHGKSITCRAENPNVTGLFVEKSWKIDVVYPPIVSLNLGSTLSPEDIKEGDDVYFECHIRANPPWSKLTWIHDNQILAHNTSARIIWSNQSLVLQSVTRSSAGKYVCAATNDLNETRSEPLHFRVKFAPVCKEDRIIVVGASKDESLDIACRVEADPPAHNFRWKFNNSGGETQDVPPGKFSVEKSSGVSVLRYTQNKEQDYGTVSCWADNFVGTQARPCLFQLVPAGKPFPVRNCTLANQTYTSVEVKCVAGYDGGLPQKFILEVYHGDVDFLSSSQPLYNVSNTDEPSFSLAGLEASVEAGVHVAVYAMNAKGRSQPVILSEVTYRDAEKRTGQDAGIVLSPLIGVVVGALVTLVLIILVVVVRVRRERVSKPRHEKPAELSELPAQQYPLQNPQQTVETDPDVIPNKFEGSLVEVSPPSYPGGYPPGHWVTPGPTPSIDELCHKFAGRPTELRLPSRSTIPSLQSMPMTGSMTAAGPGGVVLGGSQGVIVGGGQGVVVAGECLDGEAIKRRLMANRLPESCV